MIKKALALLSLSALAACGVRVDVGGIASGVTADPLTGAVTSDCMDVRGAKLLALDHALTRGGATVTALETKCAAYRSPTCADTIPKELLSCTGASCDQYKPSVAISATRGWMHRFDVSGAAFAICTFTPTGTHASDTLTIVASPVME